MICWILLLINLTSCVCGTFVVNVTQTSYQAEENHNITLEWTFTTNTGSSLNFLFIYSELITDHKVSVLYNLRDGVEITESQDEQFKGRVQCEKTSSEKDESDFMCPDSGLKTRACTCVKYSQLMVATLVNVDSESLQTNNNRDNRHQTREQLAAAVH
ncbi:uncharacterized protein LOC127363560 isoform X13 [Dicentrarchus labrax]|uniref:uncharacterized protein LOC127363560 isoform X13 n=1 Tax=Dicentrarchus labrax TaxID=13489 RepID=UPI0021F601E2|nr:uncharacterized protein LOC127363560 isoform X13 [Dicentrarchus labrax]XP_051256189.1 uncharacterized protein LOC127363560 isoform X13 [Dicentrarchus labrax]